MQLMTMPIIMQLFGVAVLFAEIFIPSGGILGLIAAGLFGYSLYIVFVDISVSAGFYLLTVDLIGLPIIIYWGIKVLEQSPATLQKSLSSREGVTSQDPTLNSFLDKQGEALADLHPSGPAFIDGKRVDVVTRGEYIGKGSGIIVVGVKGNQIVVSLEEQLERSGK